MYQKMISNEKNPNPDFIFEKSRIKIPVNVKNAFRCISVSRLWPSDESVGGGECSSGSKPTGTQNETATVTTSHESKGSV